MKLLFIAAAEFPYPPDTGSRNIVYHWLAAASLEHDVHLVVLDEEADRKEIPGLPGICIEPVKTPIGRKLPQRASRLIISALQGIPANALIYMPAVARERLRELLNQNRYEAVVLTASVAGGYASLLAPRIPVVFVEHSVQAVDAREMRNRSKLHTRWLLEEWIVRRFEGRNCRTATIVCCVNEEDARELSRRYRLSRTPAIIPIGVELSRFPWRESDPGGKVIAFFGNMIWGANVDAVNWFVEKILPTVWQTHPEAQFRIIGPGSEHLQAQGSDSRVVCTGAVPQASLPRVLQDATLGVVPVVSGTGVRFKLLEMLSMGIPTVTTSLGALGTGCVHGESSLIADDPNLFATAVTSLLSDGGLREKLRNNGRRLALQHTWEGIYPKILDVLERAARPAS